MKKYHTTHVVRETFRLYEINVYQYMYRYSTPIYIHVETEKGHHGDDASKKDDESEAIAPSACHSTDRSTQLIPKNMSTLGGEFT